MIGGKNGVQDKQKDRRPYQCDRSGTSYIAETEEKEVIRALTCYQCIQYALDKPGVLTVLPGIRSVEDVKNLWGFLTASSGERDYSVIGTFTPGEAVGNCVYCNHCQPCPAGLNVGLINKYYDLAVAGDSMAAGHYGNLEKKASDCVACGHCDRRCPFHVKQTSRMEKIAAYFGK